jgi:RNA polymerase sigma-70 factor (ECF subfamily)
LNSSETIRRARLRDESAWNDLVHQHQEAIFRLAYLILGNADDAKDIAQEAFIRAYDNFESFDSDKPLRPWLYRIASNLAYNHRRSAGRRWAALQRFRRSRSDNPPRLPEVLSIEQSEAKNLRDAVARLKRADQEIIYLRYFMDLSVDETANSLGIASGTVKSRQHRALKRLQGVIQREYPDLQKRFSYE